MLEADPKSLDALRGLAALEPGAVGFRTALEYHVRLIDLGERSPEVLYNAGLMYEKAGQLDKAVRLYRDALAQKPDMPEALLNLGHILKSNGQDGGSADLLEQGAGSRAGAGARIFRNREVILEWRLSTARRPPIDLSAPEKNGECVFYPRRVSGVVLVPGSKRRIEPPMNADPRRYNNPASLSFAVGGFGGR